MSQTPVTPELDQNNDRTASVGSWIASSLFHFVLILAMAAIWTLRSDATPQGAAEGDRTGGIVLKRLQPDGEQFEGEADAEQEATSTPAGAQVFDPIPASPSSSVQGSDPWGPKTIPGFGEDVIGEDGVPGAGDFGEGGPGKPSGLAGGAARVKIFGVQGEGHSFVYVFDRSLSMRDENRMRKAKAQLIASLKSLERTHQFQIIFYNQFAGVFKPRGFSSGLIFATAPNKELAARYVRGVTAAGATKHEPPLMLALNMQPDVIFFLSDAGDGLDAQQLAKIKRRNRGQASINTIEFNSGPWDGADDFLVRLARQNGGSFAYVDTSK